MTDRVAVIGAGQMGNGIAHVFAQSGIPVTMIDVSDDALRRGRETIEKNMDRQVKKNALSAEDRQAALGRVATSTDGRRGSLNLTDGSQVLDLRRPRSHRASRRDSRQQHEFDLHHADRGADEAPRTCDRDALHESGAGDAARGSHSRARDLR